MMLNTYTIIWRAKQDDFDFTEVEISQGCEPDTALEWVVTAIMAEYSDWSYAEKAEVIAHAANYGFDLLDVVRGKLESVL